MRNNYICALDIGSSKIAATVTEIKKRRINRIFFDCLSSEGMRCGSIVDSIDVVNSVSRLLKNLKAKSGINIKFIYTNISGKSIITKHSKATMPLAERGNKLITVSDIQRINEQARILGSSLEDEIIHLIPYSYSINSNSNVINPLGLYSHVLEVDLYLICAKISSIQSLSHVINQAGYEIKDLFFSGFATSKVVFGKEFYEGLNLFCDIGSDTTELVAFRDGSLFDIEILTMGGNDLTVQLQKELKIPFDLAEDIKRSYGVIGDSGIIGEDKEILVKKSSLYKPIKQRSISEIITTSAKSICSTIKNTIEKKMHLYEVNNFVTAGKTVLQEGFIEILENTLAIPVKLARLTNPQFSSLINEDNKLMGQKYLDYFTCLGMTSEVMQQNSRRILPTSRLSKNPILKVINKIKEVYQEYF